MMDIKTRIDGLTEAEAKAALLWAIYDIAGYRAAGIDFCVPYFEISEKQKIATLDEVLKEAQQ